MLPNIKSQLGLFGGFCKNAKASRESLMLKVIENKYIKFFTERI